MHVFMEDYVFIFIAAIITVGLTIMLRAFLVMLVQIILMSVPFIINIEAMIPILSIAQIIISGLTLYKLVKAIDMNYKIILEKTNQKQTDLIKNEHRGSRFSFWKTH